MRKYHIKFSKFWFIICILLLVIAFTTASFNIILAVSKDKLTLPLEKYFDKKITIARIIYLPPNFIILKNVSLREVMFPDQNASFFMPTVCMKLSLREILTKRHLLVSDIYVYGAKLNSYEFRNFLRYNFKQIMAFIHSLHKQDINIFIKRLKSDFTKENIGFKYAFVDFVLLIKGNSISSFGSISKVTPANPTLEFPLKYNIEALFTGNGISIEKLELARENFSSQLKGNLKGGSFRFSGFIFMNTLFKESEHQGSAFNVTENLRFFKEGPGILSVARLPQANLFILDIDCQGNFNFPLLQIERLKFSLNNNPVSLKGNIVLLDPVTIDLVISSSLMNLKYGQSEDIKNVELKIKGTLRDNIFSSNGILKLESVKKKAGGLPLEGFELGFDKLNLYFSQYPHLRMSLGEGNLFLQTNQNEYQLSWKDLNSEIFLKNEKEKFVKFSSLFYDGVLRGQGRFDTSKWPPTITAMARINNVSANKLDGLLIHFSKFRGKLASSMYFSSLPYPYLKGDMDIEKGYVYNLQFFKWLADFFDLSALKKIYFKRAASNFLVNEEGAGLQNMYLESKDVNLNGFFNLGHKDLVSSKISLSFTRELLRRSRKFTPLLNLLGKDFKNLIFDFQLSGNLHKMNFQWLQSDFKRKIQASIPHFIERKIDRDVEKIIESLSSKRND